MIILKIGLVKEHFKNVKDMFLIQNFDVLRSGITKYGMNEDGSIKSGAKVNIQYTIINAVKTFIPTSHVAGDDQDVLIFERFLSSFKIFENVIFGDARHTLDFKKKKDLGCPKSYPSKRI